MRYIGRLIEGVTIKPSPEWMQKRLIACGARPINNLVDITNYVLFEHGQPLHAFDFDKLSDGTIIVRRAQAKEPLTTLDGVARALTPETLVIADARRAVAIAGIMGGLGSEVMAQTTRVLLESARFDPILVRRTGRQLGLASESSYRFERGIDPAAVETASRRAAALIQELAGGTETAISDVGTPSSRKTAIAVDTERASRWLGMRLDAPAVRTSLARLGCRVASGAGNTLRVEPPSFRQDLNSDVDCFEELARVHGYDRMPSTIPSRPIASRTAETSTPFWQTRRLRALCTSLGLTEAVTWTLLADAELSRCGFSVAETAHLVNPLSQDHAALRPSLLPGLLQVVRRNLTQGAAGVRLFEAGHIFQGGTETQSLGIALSGIWTRDWRGEHSSDFFRLKGIIETLAARLGSELTTAPASAAVSWCEPGQAVNLTVNRQAAGVAGTVARTMLTALDIEQPVWFAELFVEPLLAAPATAHAVAAPTLFPPVKRDLSLLVDERTAYEPVLRTIQDIGGPLAHQVQLIDRYSGNPVPAGKYSLTFSIEYRDPSRTLTASEVDALHQRIGQALVERHGATLR